MTRAARSLALVKAIRGARRIGDTEAVARYEQKQRDLDEIHGYVRSSKGAGALRPLRTGEPSHGHARKPGSGRVRFRGAS